MLAFVDGEADLFLTARNLVEQSRFAERLCIQGEHPGPAQGVQHKHAPALDRGDSQCRSARYRIWHWLKVIVKNDVRIATDLMLLLMIVDTLFLRVLSVSATSQPSPQVTVNVTVDAEGIAEKVAKRSKTKGVCLVPEPTTEEKPHE